MADFLDTLPFSPTERARLRALGAPDAVTLRAMYDAAPDAFTAYMGASARHVLDVLDTASSARAPRPVVPARPLGARVDASPPAGPTAPPFDLALRDRLFAQLDAVRAEAASPQRDAAVSYLEAALDALLDR